MSLEENVPSMCMFITVGNPEEGKKAETAILHLFMLCSPLL